jgi:hypothetical protein
MQHRTGGWGMQNNPFMAEFDCDDGSNYTLEADIANDYTGRKVHGINIKVTTNGQYHYVPYFWVQTVGNNAVFCL